MGQLEQKGVIFPNIFSLNDKEGGELCRRFTESGGLGRVVVHPFFPDYYPSARGYWGDMQVVQTTLGRILSKGEERTTPLIIFEEETRVRDTQARLEGMARQKAYIVPTKIADSTPVIDGEKVVPPDEAWGHLAEELQDVGVRRLIVGGYLLVDELERDKLGGCVGRVVERLSPPFEVEISSMSGPERLSTLKRKGKWPIRRKG